MKITAHIAQHISDIFEGGNWTEVDMKNTLADITAKEAAYITRATPNSIAALVHHLAFYNDVVLKRLSGIDPVIDESNGFTVPAVINEKNWQHLKEYLFSSGKQLREAVENFPEEKLEDITCEGGSSYYKTLHGITEHAHYHLGQLVLLKKLIRSAAVKDYQQNSL